MQKWQHNLRLGAFVATVVCMLIGFVGMYNHLRAVFSDPYEDMSHGWLVPIFSLYVLWTQRVELKKTVGAPSVWGFLACLPCIGVALIGSRGMQVRFEQLGFIGLCMALPWAFYGRRVAMRLFASGTAFVMLRGFGVDVVQVGTAIVSQGAHPFSIDVAEPCSGLRSLVALTALTAAYAWYTQPTWRRRAALFACAIPLAVLGNVVRVLSICFVAAWASSDFALGFYHDYSGYVVFVVAIVCMVACGEVITRWCGRRGKAGGKTATSVAAPGADAQERVPPAAGAINCAPPVVPVVAWPDALEGYAADDILYCQNEGCSRTFFASHIGGMTNCPACRTVLDGSSLGENTILPKDTTILKRVYTSGAGMQFLVSVIISGAGKSSIHRPELCLPAQGVQMSSPTDFDVAGRPYHAIRIDYQQDPPAQLVYTFFNQGGTRTASHLRRIFLDTWDRSVHNRIDRWVMVTVRAASPYSPHGVVLSRPHDRAEVERFLRKLEEVLP